MLSVDTWCWYDGGEWWVDVVSAKLERLCSRVLWEVLVMGISWDIFFVHFLLFRRGIEVCRFNVFCKFFNAPFIQVLLVV